MLATAIRWDGCYDAGWRDLIVPGAFAHPAKMARGLVARIYEHLFTIGALERGAFVVDPFGGIGTTAIEGASRGVRVACVELEPKFCALAYQNIELHRHQWEAMGCPMPEIVQGDSRYLRDVLAGGCDALYSGGDCGDADASGRLFARDAGEAGRDLASDEGLVAPVPGGAGPESVEAIISSPPYVGAKAHPSLGHPELRPIGGDIADRAVTPADPHYGDTPGQLSDLPDGSVDAIVSSPPYVEIAAGAGGLNTRPPQHAGQQGGRAPDSASQDTDQRYGESPGQLAKLPKGGVDAVISSPPYLTGDSASAQSITTRTDKSASWIKANCGSAATQGYGTTEGQLGVMPEGETFWRAANAIVRECFALLKPGGYAVWVVKAFVRNKAVVDFPGDWQRLCEHAGFETVEEIHASLVAEEVRAGLFGDTTHRRERKSFFRRLAESKGSPRIDWETVWVMRKGTR